MSENQIVNIGCYLEDKKHLEEFSLQNHTESRTFIPLSVTLWNDLADPFSMVWD